jgi:hypothetical protein
MHKKRGHLPEMSPKSSTIHDCHLDVTVKIVNDEFLIHYGMGCDIASTVWILLNTSLIATINTKKEGHLPEMSPFLRTA